MLSIVLASLATAVAASARPRAGYPFATFAHGRALLKVGEYAYGSSVVIQPSGHTVVAGQAKGYMDPDNLPTGQAVIAGLTRQGRLDRTFGRHGFAPTFGHGARVFSRGRGRFLGVAALARNFYVAPVTLLLTAYTPDGHPNRAFADNGTARVPLGVSARAVDVASGPGGTISVLVSRLGSLEVMRFGPGGRLLGGYGTGGVASTLLAEKDQSRVLVDANGRALVIAQDPHSDVAAVTRLTVDGALDPSFGQRGVTDLPGQAKTSAWSLVQLRWGGFVAAEILPTGARILVGLGRNGSVNRRFGTGGTVDLGADAGTMLAAEPRGSFLVERFIRTEYPAYWTFCRYTPRGRRHHTFGRDGCAVVPRRERSSIFTATSVAVTARQIMVTGQDDHTDSIPVIAFSAR